MLSDQKLKSIADGYKTYVMHNFPQRCKLGYLEVQISERKEGYQLCVCFGAGWCNTPWHDELMDFVRALDKRVQTKYPSITSVSHCGYASMGAKVVSGGMFHEGKLFKQMSYPEMY